MLPPLSSEWLEPDGLGGFASGTVGGPRTRRYHALLLTATTPPTGRMVLVNGCDAWLETSAGLCSVPSAGFAEIESFTHEPWPRWVYRFADGTRVEHELFVSHGRSLTALRWRLLGPAGVARLSVRPLLSGRDYHAMHGENPTFRFATAVETDGLRVVWSPYPGVPQVRCWSNGSYQRAPLWRSGVLYAIERERGLDDIEDLASPGVFHWDLAQADAVWILAAQGHDHNLDPGEPLVPQYLALRETELTRRQAFPTPLDRAADAYVVRRGAGKTLLAGYPWFTDWGRDTFIALRGLCLARGDLTTARDILIPWAGTVSEGMVPNRFPDSGDAPEFNSVDASLWFVIAAQEFLERAAASGFVVKREEESALLAAFEQILAGYSRGTRFGIRADADGLLAAGVPGVQLTWMDAKVGDWVVTPRIGKPVEIQALWLNALWIGARHTETWRPHLERGLTSFRQLFWNEDKGCLYDVVDVDHRPGAVDGAVRPNQIFAVGGLPLSLVDGDRARRVVDVVESRLWTPLGLRSLAPNEPGYAPHYHGGILARDGAYHQGTVWAWLTGAFVEAWLRVRGGTLEARQQAQTRFLAPLLEHLEVAGLGHVSEIADADPPHTPRGCPWQAWSLGEVLRLMHGALEDTQDSPSTLH